MDDISKMTSEERDKYLESLWAEFEETPINNSDEILSDFYHWKVGTDRMDIWHWFDDNHSLGLARGLMKLD